ncbi:MAG TPA: discoidin domain-containing protein [Thermoanaerobaculaceae bacterium]|nr:discoidin domain-containing protein [Thermoanaerobaculaceae bacterium]
MSRLREHALAGVILAALAIAMTWPLVAHLGSALTDAGDPLLNTWIMAWDVHKLSAGSLAGFFEANIFFPNHRTLAYSEHLLPQALAGAIPMLVSGNPVLAYNLVLLLAFASSGFAMYLLALRLTGSRAASIFAGIVFAYSPFMMSHLPHLQVLCAAGIPLSFYFLDRFRDGERLADLLGLAATMAVQMLANGYYALILPLFVGAALLHYALAAGRLRDPRFWGRMALLAAVVAAVNAPFLAQYAAFRSETGFAREINDGITLSSYLSAPKANRLWGPILAPFLRNEKSLFPGVLAAAMAVVGIVVAWRRLRAVLPAVPAAASQRAALRLAWPFRVLAGLLVLAMVIVLTSGPFRLRFELKGDDLNRPLFFLLVLLAIRLAADARFRARLTQALALHDQPLLVYGGTLVLAFLLCTGFRGPFALLAEYVPGFDAMRAPMRVHVFFLLALAVFAGVGLAHLEARLAPRRRRALTVAACGVLLVEFACVPLPTSPVKTGREVPPVYDWLARQPGGDWGVAELPFATGRESIGREIRRVYYSTRHWKPIMSGYSGYFPPFYQRLIERWNPAPPPRDLEEMRGMGLRFVIVHPDEMDAARRERTYAALAALHPPARLAAEVGGDRVYELPGWSTASSSSLAPPGAPLVPIDREGWTASASPNPELAPLAIDGDLATRWHSGPQRRGDYFQIDFGAIRRPRGISLLLREYVFDYPLGYRVDASTDGERWTTVASRDPFELPLRAFLTPTRLAVDVVFPATACRYLRVTNLGSHPTLYWSIHEVELWQ